jgi:predicted RNA-binding Zn ribbon-like protein
MKEYADPPGETSFQLVAGHPALDLVNTLDDRFSPSGAVELLADYSDLLRFVAQAGLLDEAQCRALAESVRPAAAARALRAVRELREALANTLYGLAAGRAPRPEVLAILQRHFHAANGHSELRWQQAGPRVLWRRDRFATDARLPVWLLAHAALQLLESGAGQVHACDADSCRWLFLDTSKNHTRRWCDMKVCGNRVKAQRYQARRTRAAQGRVKSGNRPLA